MRVSVAAIAGVLVLCCAVTAEAQSPPPVAAFAGTRSLEGVALSPDGHYLAMLIRAPQGRMAFVRDLTDDKVPLKALFGSSKEAQLTWCRWTSATRLMCGSQSATRNMGLIFNASQAMAIDADGKNSTSLISGSGPGGGQLQDKILSSTLAQPNTVLVAGDQSQLRSIALIRAETAQTASAYPAVQELNVMTGAMREKVHPFPPIRNFLADRHGEIRLGWGFELPGTAASFFVRPEQSESSEWKPLVKRDDFGPAGYKPLAICVDQPDCLFATADNHGHEALWRIDLTAQAPAKLEFANPNADVAGPIFASDGRLMGVTYETDRAVFVPVDPKVRGIVLKGALGDRFVGIVDSQSDEHVFVVRTSGDVDPGTYYLLDVTKASLKLIGRAYPDLDPRTLPHMQSISFPAADGTAIPGYLTVPTGRHAAHLPLIVMPHDGPAARDHWDFDFLRLFLASRGYAVLQVNFRGSSGYGPKWLMDAHQDLGGLSYSDITDGARWAVHQGIADPAHMCILGWGYGGYEALLGAVRNGDLYHCAVSIAGFSDLSSVGPPQLQTGALSEKLKDDSPQRHASSVTMPVLLIHGDMDSQAKVEQSVAMDTELAHAHKKHELVVIKDGWHDLSLESERTALLTSIERFLAENLGPGAPAGK